MHTFRMLTALLAAAALAGALPGDGQAASDTIPPVPESPTLAFRGAAITTEGIPLRASWVVSDPSGISSSQVQMRIDGGSWVTQRLTSPAQTSLAIRVPPPHHAQLRVRATDRAGNTGPWVVGDAFRVRRFGEASSAVTRVGRWSRVTSPGFFGGTAYRSTTTNARLDITFTGRLIAMVGRRAPSGGHVAQWVGTTSSIGAPLFASTTRDRLVIGGLAAEEGAPRTLHVSVSEATVWFDGFVVVDTPPADPVLVGAGDIARCNSTADEKTAKLLDGIAGRVFAAGDTVYQAGTAAEYRTCYEPGWGRWRLRTSPVPGNHEYMTGGGAPYWAYFGSRAGTPGKGWYAYDLGTWRIYNLNANCTRVGCGPDSEQGTWLAADLAANPRACVAAIWHQPLFSSGKHGGAPNVQPLWQALEDAGADLVVNGHDHIYERFAPQRADGTADPDGMTGFVIGMGGGSRQSFGTAAANSLVRQNSAYGLLKLTLRAGAYDYQFVGVPGSTFRDAGSAACR